MALEVKSCCAAWREARRKKDWPVRVDRRIREREGGELDRSVVSEQRGTSGSYVCHPEVHLATRSSWSLVLGSGSGSNDVTAGFVITFGRQSPRPCVAPRRIYL